MCQITPFFCFFQSYFYFYFLLLLINNRPKGTQNRTNPQGGSERPKEHQAKTLAQSPSIPALLMRQLPALMQKTLASLIASASATWAEGAVTLFLKKSITTRSISDYASNSSSNFRKCRIAIDYNWTIKHWIPSWRNKQGSPKRDAGPDLKEQMARKSEGRRPLWTQTQSRRRFNHFIRVRVHSVENPFVSSEPNSPTNHSNSREVIWHNFN